MQRAPKCPACSTKFATKDPARPHGPRLPLLLSCGHSFCDACLTKQAKSQKTSITCPSCKSLTSLKGEEGSVKGLSPDVYILGLLAVNRRTLLDQQELKLFPNVTAKKNGEKSEMCTECSRRAATCRCGKCEAVMCDSCFHQVHARSNVLKNHKAEPIKNDTNVDAPLQLVCATHQNRPIEYYCEDDEEPICSHCVILGPHKKHAISAIEEKNKKASEELEPALVQATAVLQRLKKSEKVLHNLVPNMRQNMEDRVDEIKNHFQMLHGVLQAREDAVLKEMFSYTQQDSVSIYDQISAVKEHHADLENWMKEARKLLNNNNVIGNAQSVLSKLRGANNIASYACVSRQDGRDVHVVFDEQVTKSLNEYGIIQGKPNLSVKLVPMSEMGDEQDVDDNVSVSSLSTVATEPVDIVGSEADSETASLTSETDSLKPKLKAHHKKRRRTRPCFVRQELVLVTHIKNPCSFMVQRMADTGKMSSLSMKISRHCESPESGQALSSVQEGELVFAHFSDGSWYRGRVMRLVWPEDPKTDPYVPKVEVLYIDYGNSELVPLNKLKAMPTSFSKIPEVCYTCALVDIAPASENGQWSHDALIHFVKMTADKPMYMTVISGDTDPIRVDLCKPPNDDIEDDRPASVRDSLVFLEEATFTSDAMSPSLRDIMQPKLKQFLKHRDMEWAIMTNGVIVHADSPSNFYIQQVGVESVYLYNMMEEIQTTYSQDTGDLYSVFVPQKNMICVAEYSLDHRYYRAQVTNLPGRRYVAIQYVDYGNTETVSHLRLRKILDKYLVLPVQAHQCRLVDVEPVDPEKGWSVKAHEMLVEVITKSLAVSVKGFDDDGKMLVQLTDMDTEICLNSELVETGQAKSTGPSSAKQLKNTTFLHPETVNGDVEDVKPKVEDASEIMPSTEPSADGEPGHVETSKLRDAIDASKFDPDKPPHCKVTISHIVSPGHLYAQLATAGKDGLASLMNALKARYSESCSEKTKWAEREHCAALYAKNKKWHRGKITKLVTEDSAEVSFFDFGYSDTIPFSQLFPLDKKFMDQPFYAIRCHLSDITPAGHISKWTSTSCEYLAEILEEKICYIVQKEEGLQDGSLAIDLLLEEVIRGDALSPDKVVYKSVSQMLRDKGVALPKRKSPPIKKEPSPVKEEPVTVKAMTVPSPTPSLEVVAKEAEIPKRVLDTFKQPILPTDPIMTGLATYVDYDCLLYVQNIYPEESPFGRYGYILKENTLEFVIQEDFLQALKRYRVKIPRDGNCLFRAFAQGIFADQDKHADIRKTVCDSLRDNWTLFEPILGDGDKDKYIAHMSEDGSYGGEPEIIVLCWSFNVSVRVYMGGLTYPVTARNYSEKEGATVLEMAYVADGKYDSGHYDMVVRDESVARNAEERYFEWRQGRVAELQAAPSLYDNTVYEETMLQQVMEHLQEIYMTSTPDPDATWEVGQCVIALFREDHTFYRAVITAISDKGIQVLYVDFGNRDIVPADWLRKHLALTNIPEQCLTCILYDVIPIENQEKWPKETLEYIHSLIVGSQCTYYIQEPPQHGIPLQVSVTLPDGRDLSTRLVAEGRALFKVPDIEPTPSQDTPGVPELSQVNPAVVEPTSINSLPVEITNAPLPERIAPSPFKPMPVPDIDDVMLVSVTQVERPDRIYVQYVLEEPTTLPPIVSKQLNELLLYADRLYKEADNYPPLNDPKPGQLCCGKYTMDESWYRTEIICREDKPVPHVGVIYVDYGTSEYIPFNRLRQLPVDMTQLPAMSRRCKLVGLMPAGGGDEWDVRATSALTEVLLDKILIALHVATDDEGDLHVQLYEHDEFTRHGFQAPLVYQHLIEQGLVYYHRQDSESSVIIEGAYEEGSEPDHEDQTSKIPAELVPET